MSKYGILSVVSAAVLTGCATTQVVRMYAGDARDASTLCQLEVASEFDVKSIDGAATGGGGPLSTAKLTVYEMLPGAHDIVARFYSPLENGVNDGGTKVDRSDFQTLRIEAVAGTRYLLAKRREDRGVALFVESNGRVVSSKPVVPKGETGPLPSTKPAAMPVAHERADDVPRITPLDNLKQWWHYASPQEREQFRAWIDAK